MSQFSYELDERQIRIMLQSAELDYSETAWQQFDALVKLETARPKMQAPKFNFGLSRQVLVPAFFVVVICGLSALLFSFVDFKKKAAPAQAESASMMANEDKREMPAQKNTAAPLETPVKKDTVALAVKQATTAPVEIQKLQEPAAALPALNTPAVQKTESKQVAKKEEPKLITKKEAPVLKKKRRRRTTETFEDLPAINTSLSSGNSEPEPEIKLN